MALYTPEFSPSTAVDEDVKAFVVDFYATSDTHGKNDEWADFFHDGATLVMAMDTAHGREEILKLRQGMWEKVAARKHTLGKVFPGFAGPGGASVELMLHGSVEYRLKTGETQSSDWAGHARLERAAADGAWKFAHYRVYIQR